MSYETSRRERRPWWQVAVAAGSIVSLAATVAACGSTGKRTSPGPVVRSSSRAASPSPSSTHDPICAVIKSPNVTEVRVQGDRLVQDDKAAWATVKSQIASLPAGEGYGLALNQPGSTNDEMYHLNAIAQREIPDHQAYGDLYFVNTSKMLNGEAGIDAMYFGTHDDVQALFDCQ